MTNAERSYFKPPLGTVCAHVATYYRVAAENLREGAAALLETKLKKSFENEQARTLAHFVIFLRDLKCEERVAALQKLTELWCADCGNEAPCNCWKDE